MILFTSFIKRSGVIGHLWRVIHVYFISHLAASAHRTCSGAYEEEDGGTDIISINSEVRNLRACIAWYGPCLFFDRVRLTLGPSGLQGVKQFQCEVMALISLTLPTWKCTAKSPGQCIYEYRLWVVVVPWQACAAQPGRGWCVPRAQGCGVHAEAPIPVNLNMLVLLTHKVGGLWVVICHSMECSWHCC